jgi:hypothetical protein
MKAASKVTNGFNYAMGSWILEEKDGIANALICPAFHGVFPVVDWCRGYVAVVFTKNILEEPKNQLYLPMKDAIDEKRASRCN